MPASIARSACSSTCSGDIAASSPADVRLPFAGFEPRVMGEWMYGPNITATGGMISASTISRVGPQTRPGFVGTSDFGQCSQIVR
jgi:hypothetical protein